MIYLCDLEKIETAKYYAQKIILKGGMANIYRNYKFRDVGHLLTGNPYCPPCNIIEIKDKRPPQLERKIDTPKFNNTFLCVESLKLWNIFSDFEILTLNPEDFISSLNRIQEILTPEAFKWIKNRFKNTPNKLDIELLFLLQEYKLNNNISLSLEYVFYKYEGLQKTDLLTYLKTHKLGHKLITTFIYESSDSELWSIFIGSEKKEPYIYYLLKNSKDYKTLRILDKAQEAIKEGRVDIKTGLVLFNEGIRLAEEQDDFESSWDEFFAC